MAQVETDKPEELKLDMKMGVTVGFIRKGKDGKNIISYKFRPVL